MTRQPSERDPPLTLHRQTPIDQIARLLAESNVALAPHATTGSCVRRGRERVLPREEDVQEYAEGPDLGGEHGVGFAGKDFGSGIGPSAVKSAWEEEQTVVRFGVRCERGGRELYYARPACTGGGPCGLNRTHEPKSTSLTCARRSKFEGAG